MKYSAKVITIFVLTCCIVMGFVDAVWQPNYFMKSSIKVVLFVLLPLFYFMRLDKSQFLNLLKINKRGFFTALILGITLFVLIVASYLLFGDLFDFSAVTTALTGNVGITAENFIFVALYISFINSFLEEFFFRGFAFLTLLKVSSRKYAYLLSSVTFAFYHVAMMIGWFEWSFFLLTLVSLIVAAIFFNWLNEKHGNIYTSWVIHMCANFGINTVGLILFGLF